MLLLLLSSSVTKSTAIFLFVAPPTSQCLWYAIFSVSLPLSLSIVCIFYTSKMDLSQHLSNHSIAACFIRAIQCELCILHITSALSDWKKISTIYVLFIFRHNFFRYFDRMQCYFGLNYFNKLQYFCIQRKSKAKKLSHRILQIENVCSKATNNMFMVYFGRCEN